MSHHPKATELGWRLAKGVQSQDISSPNLIKAQVRELKQRVLFSKFNGIFGGANKAVNWGGLSGWSVNGGLPSLGKRSRELSAAYKLQVKNQLGWLN